MQLTWSENKSEVAPTGVLSHNKQHILHLAECRQVEELAVKAVVVETVGLSTQLLADNIEDDSLYLLFRWQPDQAVLSVVVTDERKENDATHVVRCAFPELNNKMALGSDSFKSMLTFWIRDYLTTSSDFMRFSLVAIFTDSTRDHTSML